MKKNSAALALHRRHRGKIEINAKVKLDSLKDYSLAYTPGVADAVLAIAKNKKSASTLTNRANQVAIVSDGSAVLGLGNTGPESAIPVMEGKSAIFKKLAGIDAIPLCIKARESHEIIDFCKMIRPSFAGINLEDISAPRCFEITEALEKELDIPVFHDDQDGTAIAVMAGLINACRIANKVLKEQEIIINGAGAAGIAIGRLLLGFGAKRLVMLDSAGIIYSGRKGMNRYKQAIAAKINRKKIKGGLTEAMAGADIFIGVSTGNIVGPEMVKSMRADPIVFALANPTPEIHPGLALKAGASIAATGRPDYPNQINNALVFPGLFKGLLAKPNRRITRALKIKLAATIAYSIRPEKKRILPLITDAKLVRNIEKAIWAK